MRRIRQTLSWLPLPSDCGGSATLAFVVGIPALVYILATATSSVDCKNVATMHSEYEAFVIALIHAPRSVARSIHHKTNNLPVDRIQRNGTL
jgi:hypothetical protein